MAMSWMVTALALVASFTIGFAAISVYLLRLIDSDAWLESKEFF
ncbi:hypothetical protein [Bradyrhizobium sp. USDA 4353]